MNLHRTLAALALPSLLGAALALPAPRADAAQSTQPVALVYCLGPKSAAPCPCGNQGEFGEGCVNSTGSGALLGASGSSVVANDDLVFTVVDAVPNQPCVVLQGSSPIAVPFQDGILCVGVPTERAEAVFLDASGSGSTAGSIAVSGDVAPGDVRYYQGWYRDPHAVAPCGSGSNSTIGLSISWE